MDSASYIVESAVTRAPIERSISDYYNAGYFLTVGSADIRVAAMARTIKARSATVMSTFEKERKFDSVGATTDQQIQGKKGVLVASALVKPTVPSVVSELKMEIYRKLDSICLLDSAALIDADQSRVALRAVVDTVEDYIKSEDFWSLNELLALADPSSMRKITSVAVLRSSYRIRSKLTNWSGMYAKVEAYLNTTGQDAQRALRGLNRAKGTQFA